MRQFIEVEQGNAKGKKIEFNSENTLFTQNLGPCIAITISCNEKKFSYMIHSDSNTNSGIGSISLKDALVQMDMPKEGRIRDLWVNQL